MSLYACVCNNTVVIWPLFIELIVSFYVKIAGKIFVTQGKLRENTGNFILARMWPPCYYYRPQTKFGAKYYFYTCLSFCSQGGSAWVHAGVPPPTRHTNPPGPGTPPPGTRHTTPFSPPGPGTPPPSPPPGPGTPPPGPGRCGQRVVRILLECNLVCQKFFRQLYENERNWIERSRRFPNASLVLLRKCIDHCKPNLIIHGLL